MGLVVPRNARRPLLQCIMGVRRTSPESEWFHNSAHGEQCISGVVVSQPKDNHWGTARHSGFPDFISHMPLRGRVNADLSGWARMLPLGREGPDDDAEDAVVAPPGSHREETQMDALPITPGELVCLGSSLAFSGLFYYLHRRKAKVVAKIQEAPKLQVSDSLPSILSATSGSCLRYVAIEGVVQPAESALTSPYHKELQGVIERLVLKEHRLVWNSLARSWTDSERVVLEQVHTVPFVLTPPSGSPAGGQVSVESPLSALELPLETVYERFQQTSHGFKDLVGHYLSGEKPKGFLETEEMLLVGSSLTGIGELALCPDGSLHLQPPADGAGYFLRLGDWQTLLAELESASSFWKWAAALSGLAAGAVLLHALHRAYRRRRLKQEAAAERQAFDDLRLHKPSALDLSDEPPEHTCIICLTNLRECVLLPCGHVCCCFSCFQALPSRCCPICRGPISRVVPLYQA